MMFSNYFAWSSLNSSKVEQPKKRGVNRSLQFNTALFFHLLIVTCNRRGHNTCLLAFERLLIFGQATRKSTLFLSLYLYVIHLKTLYKTFVFMCYWPITRFLVISYPKIYHIMVISGCSNVSQTKPQFSLAKGKKYINNKNESM